MVQSSRGSYAGVMVLGAASACLVGWALGAGLGGDTTSQTLVVASLVIIGIIAMLPGLVLTWPCGASRFGGAILIATMLQTLAAVALGALWTMTRSLDRVPFWSALIIGAGVLLTVEVAYAILLLTRAQGRFSQGVSDSEAG